MSSISVSIVVLMPILALLYLLWFRFNAECSMARELFELSDNQKHYLSIALQKQRIEIDEQAETDDVLLSGLEESGWLIKFSDGVYVADSKLHYLNKRLNKQ